MRFFSTVLLLGLLCLAGCGQKGPLQLPQEPASEVDRKTKQ